MGCDTTPANMPFTHKQWTIPSATCRGGWQQVRPMVTAAGVQMLGAAAPRAVCRASLESRACAVVPQPWQPTCSHTPRSVGGSRKSTCGSSKGRQPPSGNVTVGGAHSRVVGISAYEPHAYLVQLLHHHCACCAAKQFDPEGITFAAGLDFSPSYNMLAIDENGLLGSAALAKAVVPWAKIIAIHRVQYELIFLKLVTCHPLAWPWI